jgi:uncharacterized membrane protein
MKSQKDAHHRSLLKALSWRIFGSTTTTVIVFIFTGKLAMSAGIGAIEFFGKLLIFYVHERVWDHIGVGKKIHPLAGLAVKKDLSKEHIEQIKEKLQMMGYMDGI